MNTPSNYHPKLVSSKTGALYKTHKYMILIIPSQPFFSEEIGYSAMGTVR